MMKKVLASLVMLFAGISVFSQNYNLPYSGTTPVTSCSGSIFDPGGPTGNYSNGCSGSILLSNPSGLPINFILASFYTESGYDYLTIYDGNSNSAPVVRQFNGYYSGTTSFSSTSPVVLIEFESDNSGTYEGFRLNFSSPAGGSSVFADFVAPSGNLPVNWPIQFTNTGSNDAGYRWEFGDGGTSTDKHPSHSFSYGGTFPVKLVTRNCVAQDSITKNVTIDAAPVISVTPASLNVSISGCNDSVTVPLTIKNTGLGVLSFNATENSGSEDFEDGLDYSLWTNVVGGSVQIGCPEGGNNTNALYFNSNNAKYAETTTLDLSSLDTLHYDLYLGGSTPGCSLVENGYNVYLSYSVDGGITYTQIADYFNQGTVGFEHQAVVIPVAARTANTVLRWSQPYGYYLNYNNWGLDNIRFKKSAKVTCSPASASVEAGQELVVNVTVYSGGMTAGTYASSVTITNNQPGREIINVPLTYTIVGAASLESNKACIDFGTLQQNESKTDSLLLSNTGCKAVFLNSSSTTSAEFSDSYSSGNLAAFGSQKIAVTFSPTTVGNFSDTLTIVSPSGSVKVCLKGTSVPSPEFYITPDSVSVTINSCNDSVTIPVTIYNTGQGPMTFSVDSSSFGGSKRILLVDVENASGLTSYQNMKSLILAEHPGAVTETTGSPDFAANLKNF
ncbi:MAG: choice-of-anchor D domain-containing protein, partial [Bacteroidota bacterium]